MSYRQEYEDRADANQIPEFANRRLAVVLRAVDLRDRAAASRFRPAIEQSPAVGSAAVKSGRLERPIGR